MKYVKLFESWDQESHDRLVRMGLAKSVEDWEDKLTDLLGDYESDYLNLDIPTIVLAQLAKRSNWEIRAIVAQNKNSPIETLFELADDTDPDVRYCVVANPKVPIDILVKLSNDDSASVRYIVAQNRRTPEPILSKLTKDDDRFIQAEAINTLAAIKLHKGKQPEVFEELGLEDTQRMIKMGLLKPLADWEIDLDNDSKAPVPTGVLDLLIAHRDDWSTKVKVVNHPAVSGETLARLADDESGMVRLAVAKRTNAGLETLIKLSNDMKYLIRREVASNLSCPIEALVQLSKDDSSEVREHVALNPNTPESIVDQLAVDPDDDVRQATRLNRRRKDDSLDEAWDQESHDRLVRMGLAKSIEEYLRDIAMDQTANVPQSVLTRMADDPDWEIRSIAASSHRLSNENFVGLANDMDKDVRVAVASNPKTPAEILTALASDDYVQVRDTIVSNKSTPIEVLEKLAKTEKVKRVRQFAIRRLDQVRKIRS
jgi:hypothetical protein